jgi:tyrosinase
MTNGSTNVVRTRADVWTLSKADPWHPTLLWYAKAVAEMKTRPITDPTSWRYQAAIHDYKPADDPYAQPGQPMPPAAAQKSFWKQCQHSSWFFLPWHRMYLGCFEQIVTAAVVKLGGPSDWALPYWNYSDANNHNALVLPPAFRAAKTPDGRDNPLFIQARDPDINAGQPMDPHSVALGCLRDSVFTGVYTGAHPGFGGPKTVFNHDKGSPGGLEMTPHGDVHMAVGGQAGGWMSAFDTAALDPIFWLHHANIDRLWEVWRGRTPANVNPTDPAWLGAAGAKFQLHDDLGAVKTFTPSQVVDTTAPPLGYKYQDTSDPLATAAPAPALGALLMSARMTEPPHPAELVGASTAPTPLASGPVTEHVSITAPTGPALTSLTAMAEPGAPAKRAYLNLEHITASGRPPSYGVYLNLPAGDADPQGHEELFAGTLPMFGVAEASLATDEHGGGGLTYVLDVTDLVERLKARGAWDPAKMHVTFAPLKAGADSGGVKVGRVSLYYH